MRLNPRAMGVLVWADAVGIKPRLFSAEDEFTTFEGYLVKLDAAVPKEVVWVPNPDTLGKVLKSSFGLNLSLNERDGLILASITGLDQLLEGAGESRTEALISLLERLRDAYPE